MESFDALFRRYLRTAVLLHHPYPPHTGRRTNSKFGGLPRLPAHYEWPRNPEGVPLHFLVQVDCADIPFRTALPERGVLFFFGRDDEQQIWSGDTSNCRVIYAPDASATTAPRDAPADLRPVGGVNYRRAPMTPFLRRDEAGPNVHVEWPIQPLPIDTWPGALHAYPDEPDPKWISFEGLRRHLFGSKRQSPETWQKAEERGRQYEQSLRRLRADAFARATGEPPDSAVADMRWYRDVGLAIFGDDDDGPEAYPQHWLTLHYAVRSALYSPYQIGRVTGSGDEERVTSTGEEWLRRSEEHDLDEPVSAGDRAAFRAWLVDLRRRRGDPARLTFNGAETVISSMIATIRAWAGDPLRAARLSPRIYSQLRLQFSGAYAQMLGHSPVSDNAVSVDEPSVCLLNLASDNALGTFFDEAGYGTFWIEPDDLARRDFSKVVATIGA